MHTAIALCREAIQGLLLRACRGPGDRARVSKGSFYSRSPEHRRTQKAWRALGRIGRRLEEASGERMPSTVVSPGFRLTASHAADTAALGGSRIVHRMKPCYVSLMDPASPLRERAEKIPSPTLPCAKHAVIRAHQSY